MSDGSFESRSTEDRFMTPGQWADLRRQFVRQAHAERQRAIETAFASAFGWLRSAARLTASAARQALARKASFTCKASSGRITAWARASPGKTEDLNPMSYVEKNSRWRGVASFAMHAIKAMHSIRMAYLRRRDRMRAHAELSAFDDLWLRDIGISRTGIRAALHSGERDTSRHPE